MNALNQIAKHLEIDANQIKRCEEWAKVWFVVIQGKGGRFVSKAVVAVQKRAERIIDSNQKAKYCDGSLRKGYYVFSVKLVERIGRTLNYYEIEGERKSTQKEAIQSAWAEARAFQKEVA